MRFETDLTQDGSEPEANAALEQALSNFRSNVHAWSEAAYAQARPVVVPHHVSWRLATGWALGCVLAVGSIAGGVYDRHHRQQLAKIAAAQAARQQKLAEAQRMQNDDEDLLAKVDSDVSRQVPSAMEPLAQLMADDQAR